MKIIVSELEELGEKNYIFLKQFNDFTIGQEEVHFTKPVQLKATAEVHGKEIHVRGEISANISLSCNRCLENYNTHVQADFWERFIKEEQFEKIDSKDDDLHPYTQDSIYLDEYVMQNIILALPVKRVCSQECKGLCPKCGSNLNEEACSCEVDNVDPRLAKLKDFFGNN